MYRGIVNGFRLFVEPREKLIRGNSRFETDVSKLLETSLGKCIGCE